MKSPLFVPVLFFGALSTSTTATTPPAPTLTFRTTMQIAEAFSTSPGAVGGDGCLAAEAYLQEGGSHTAVSNVVFDGVLGRLHQDNTALKRIPTQNLTTIGRWDLPTPQEWDELTDATGQVTCRTEPLPPVYCPNGTKTCPPTFGSWGGLNPFTSVLGMWYPNTTKVAELPESEYDREYDLYQLEDVRPTLLPNEGCGNPSFCTMEKCSTCVHNGAPCTQCPCEKCIMTVNVTRNYTYTVAKARQHDGTRQLMRFQWTQGIPLQKTGGLAKRGERDCFIFDWRKGWSAGVHDDDFAPPSGVKCQ
jgi:hypothetical protein